MDRRRDGAERRRRTHLDVKSRHQKVSQAPTRAGAWTASCRREATRVELVSDKVSSDV